MQKNFCWTVNRLKTTSHIQLIIFIKTSKYVMHLINNDFCFKGKESASTKVALAVATIQR